MKIPSFAAAKNDTFIIYRILRILSTALSQFFADFFIFLRYVPNVRFLIRRLLRLLANVHIHFIQWPAPPFTPKKGVVKRILPPKRVLFALRFVCAGLRRRFPRPRRENSLACGEPLSAAGGKLRRASRSIACFPTRSKKRRQIASETYMLPKSLLNCFHEVALIPARYPVENAICRLNPPV